MICISLSSYYYKYGRPSLIKLSDYSAVSIFSTETNDHKNESPSLGFALKERIATFLLLGYFMLIPQIHSSGLHSHFIETEFQIRCKQNRIWENKEENLIMLKEKNESILQRIGYCYLYICNYRELDFIPKPSILGP